MATKMQLGETSCGALCQHPGCWQSNVRMDKGFPRMMQQSRQSPDIDLDLPTMKVCNMLDDYGEDPNDMYPAKFGGKPYHERSSVFPELQSPRRVQSIKTTRAPQTSPKSSAHVESAATKPPKFKVVEVQEVFDPDDLKGTWDDTFISKSYFVWVPNKKKKKKRGRKVAASWNESGITVSKKGPQFVQSKDVTEDMVPKEIEDSRLTARFDEWPVLKKKKSRARSPTLTLRPFTITPRTTRGSSKMEFDHEGISELLDLPRDILVKVLDNTRQSDLMSRDKIRDIIKQFMPPQLDRGYTNISLASQDLLQQKKLSLHEGNKNLRQPQLMETKPVFYLDDDIMDEPEDEDLQRSASPYGSLKDLYIHGLSHSRDFSRYKKPLPSITGKGGRAVSAREVATSKIPSISLGLPELPSGIRQTKPFTYNKKTDFDFTLAPVPTPPTSVRSTGTPGSDHGTTIRVNVPSQASDRSEKGSLVKPEGRDSPAQPSPDQPLHAVSPTFSTGVPKAPATTPATYPRSPSKSTPMVTRDLSGATPLPNTPQDWPPREKTGSPSQILRAPVNTPGSVLQEQIGLGTIQEAAVQEDFKTDQPVPVSRGRSVRFEIPEVPPPPSSPQLSDKDSTEDPKEPSRNTVTVNTIIPKETPSTSSKPPMSGYTIRSDANTVNTSIKEEDSNLAQTTGPTREISMVSSPEPWPQVQDADYDVAPAPSTETTLHDTPNITSDKHTEQVQEEGNHSRNAIEEKPEEMKKEEEKPSTTVKELDQDYINKNVEQTSVVKKIMEESRKSESPAPPPPSPEAKEEDEIKVINKTNSVVMTPLMEETEHMDTQADKDDDVTMTVMQIGPKGPMPGGKKSNNRQIDTFVNIDIPASNEGVSQPRSNENLDIENQTIPEEPEPTPEESKRDVALSVQSTLANRTISERADTEYTTSMVEPAMSQASQGPALSEDYSDKPEKSDLLGDWTGMIVGSSSGPDTMAMLSSDKPDMTEEGGDHEGFKEDLKRKYEKLNKETEENEGSSEVTS